MVSEQIEGRFLQTKKSREKRGQVTSKLK